MSTGLLLIDIQNDYFTGGSYPLYQPENAAAQAQRVLRAFREKGAPVFHVQHISRDPHATFFIPGTAGVKISDTVLPRAGEPVIEKHAPDSFFETELQAALTAGQVDRLVVCGMMTHMCVDTTVRAARSRGYGVTLIEDACATRALTWKEAAFSAPTVQAVFMAALSEGFAEITTAGEWLARP